MKKEKQGNVTYERLNKSIGQDIRPSEAVEKMLINDIERVLKSYFIYQTDDFKSLFIDNGVNQEFTFTLKYSRFKDVKVL
ncbi:MAG: hypothetical protein IJ033_03200 [Clostridia bacterium]|nr:hypothetical protein [Clostridia bacterium]